MNAMISVEELNKHFSHEKALDGLTFNVKQGEIFGFLGPSGAGKTTTIKILTGQLLPTSGKATLFNVDSKAVSTPKYLKRLGIMTDNSGLYQRLNVYENLKLYAELYEVPNPKKRIRDVLEIVNLSNSQKKQVSKLSKGMTQRVLLARAILHEPELLFLDEPTAALDPSNSQHIHNGLRELNKKGTTIFLTTHDMFEAETLCDRVAFLNKGRVQLLDEPRKLRRQFSDNTVTVELANGEKRVLSMGTESAQPLYDLMKSGEVMAITSNEPTLGDIFVNITGRELV
ncbi:ABC transporter ATP-binding protein [Salipaludibacillus agaradhaerens]|uniref:ABC transporter ATP-binding protein n=1 Tax=Salipaludibacillus agaradhaerens TaxID=76935 RepID=UPI0021509981|nr:ABC transporter ATP-binding protein [Salipaludibacillus agaradhaerens]MCR6105161.1 ABC transporter ATP-binding protein [Salipaludibacillus agaradhaerens]MCR6117206.1 ABC transporter ATP-binding protein [Salipaludibacillus agaradhaerens]UJW56401.1 ABC transporter ATP-binding protein [Bacillus sp. A116_S68]